MTQRFWAPQRATVTPDQVVLALLEPGGDPAGDLGNALLAVHRAGAASCEAVAKGPVPSEHGLVSALATTRAALASPAVDSVSKSLEANYAGLLVRDVFDDAEQSTLALFRTCVSKGVAPPIAASRAGAVYGVPSRELGKYTALAVDPRANPAALTDAADRALLTYVSKLVTEEAGEVKEVVSKSPTGHARELGDSEAGWDEREHPRDRTSGRFTHTGSGGAKPVREGDFSSIELPGLDIGDPGILARLRSRVGLGGQRAPEVGTTPAQARQRQLRQLREKPKGRLRPTGTQAQVAGSVTGRVSGRVQGDVVGRAQAKLAAALAPATTNSAAANAGSAYETAQRVPAPKKSGRDWTGTAIERVADTGHEYHAIRPPNGEALTYVMMQSESAALRRTMPEVDAETLPGRAAPRLVRAHALEKTVTTEGPAFLDMDEPLTSMHAEHARAEAGQAAKEDIDPSGYATPLVASIGPDDAYGDRDQALMSMRQRLSESAGTDVNGNYRTDLEADAFAHSVSRRDYHDPDRWWAIVPQADAHGDYALPFIDEYVVNDDVKGYLEGGHRSQQIIVDPNQAFLVKAEAEQYYDAQQGVMINRWTLVPLEEDELELYSDPRSSHLFGGKFGKGLDGHDSVRFEQQHPRDEEGRFAPTMSRTSGIAPLQIPSQVETASQEAKVRAQPRQMRQMRQLKRAPAARRPLVAPGTARGAVQGQLNAEVKAKVATPQGRIQAMMTQVLHEKSRVRDMPVLDDRSNYKLMTKAEFDDIRRKIDGGGSGVLPLYGPALHMLRGKSDLNGSQVVAEMNFNLEAEINNNEGEATKGYVWQRKPIAKGPLRSEADEMAMGRRIRDLFESHPNIAQIHIDYAGEPGTYQLYANREPVDEQILIEMDPEIDLEGPVELVELGPYRSMEMLHRRSNDEGAPLVAITGETPFAPINARMQQFRLQNARVRRYRMQNGE